MTATPKFPPLPLDLDNTNPRITFQIKAGELSMLLRRWGDEVYRRAYAAGQASCDNTTPTE